MILRRVIEHVRHQQWTAIFIDLVIVVLGVVIGLQVNNWNEERRDRARERVYLENIAAELDESIVSIKRSIELSEQRIALDELLIKASTDVEAVRAEPGRFIYAVTRGGWTFAPTLSGNTFEEMKSSGNLGILRDRALVLDLMRFYGTVQYESQWGQFKAFSQMEYFKRAAGILTAQELKLAPANSRVIPTVDAEVALGARKRMLERPEFIEWVSTTLFDRTDDLNAGNQLLEQAQELRARVLAQPGVAAAKAAAP